MADKRQTNKSTMASSLKNELALLFGEQVLAKAETSRVEDLNFSADEIVQAARELRRLSGHSKAQIELAQSLPDDVQAALCLWLTDDRMQAKTLAARGIRLQ